MLENITLENFKAFKSLNQLALRPVTILSGINSCGKSSILQSILLLKQTVESKNPNQTLLLNGRFVHLGAFENVVYEKNLDNTIKFKFSFNVRPVDFTLARRSRHQAPLSFLFRGMVGDRTLFSRGEHLISYEVNVKASTKPAKRYLGSLVVPHACFDLVTRTPDGEIIPGSRIEMTIKESDAYDLKWRNLESYGEDIPKSGTGEANITFTNLFPMSITVPGEPGSNRKTHAATYLAYRMGDIFQSILSSFTYIGPLREEPSRRYIYEDEIVEIGTKGENAAYIYLSEQEDDIKPPSYFYNSRSDSFVAESGPLKLSIALSRWLDLMKITDFRAEPVNEIIYLKLNSSSSRKTRVNIADVGFGVSQIFPILLEGLRMPRGSTLLLEQPEIHLHPNLQMQMADYFISLALSGKRVIVETHSDHIINRLVRRIVEDVNLNLKDQIAIYFIRPNVDGAVFEEIKIDDKRGIINWPEDFFDQTALEQEKILQAGLKKRQAARAREGKK